MNDLHYRAVIQAASIICFFLMSGCTSTLFIPDKGTSFNLAGCPPLMNCVSTESSCSLYQIPPIPLKKPLTPDSWQKIKMAASELDGAVIDEDRYGYIDITCYSAVFHFPDFLEVLISEDQKSLQIRSASMLGLWDLGVNGRRVEAFRARLKAMDISN